MGNLHSSKRKNKLTQREFFAAAAATTVGPIVNLPFAHSAQAKSTVEVSLNSASGRVRLLPDPYNETDVAHQLVAMSREVGLPEEFQGCQLSFIDIYFVSGHVPTVTVNKLLTERPDIKGITLPNMPQGSPGMSGVEIKPLTIFAMDSGKPQVHAIE